MAASEELFNPFRPEFHADPYSFYHRLRSVEPVHQTSMGFWVLTRYDDVVMVLRDPRFGRDGFEHLLAAVYGDDRESGRLSRSMLFRDPPDHTRLRALVSKAFTPRVIESMRAHIREIVDRLLDRVQDSHGMDVIADLAYPLPVTVICEMLGVPAGDKLSEGELLATCILLFIAGHETTVNLIGNGTLALLRHPDQLGRLREDPALIHSAVEELLRYDSPVQRTARITNTDVEVDGRAIAKGSMVVAAIGAANRDPAHFPEPDRLDIARRDNRHVAFGFGIHFCLGAPLRSEERRVGKE